MRENQSETHRVSRTCPTTTSFKWNKKTTHSDDYHALRDSLCTAVHNRETHTSVDTIHSCTSHNEPSTLSRTGSTTFWTAIAKDNIAGELLTV